MNDHPDLTMDFFGMITRYLKYTPEIFFKCQSLDSIFKLAEIGIPVSSPNAGEQVTKFVIRIMSEIYQEPDQSYANEIA